MAIGFQKDKRRISEAKQSQTEYKFLKDALLDWLVSGARTRRVFIGQNDDLWPIAGVVRQLAGCRDLMPSWACIELELPIDSTYLDAALVLEGSAVSKS